MTPLADPTGHEGSRYVVRLAGHLHPRWAARLEGMTLTRLDDGTTVLDGAVEDQAALHGLLRTFRDLGLPLISLSRIDPPAAPPAAPPTPRSTPRLEPDMTTTSTTTTNGTVTGRPPTRDWTRGYARAGGIAYLITFAASIPAIPLLGPILNDPDFILSGTASTQVSFGALLDTVNAIACIATAVAVFPVVRRQNESLALGFVASRLMEAAIIIMGVVSLLAVVTLRQDVAGTPGADPASLLTTGQALVAVRDWTFNFGPNVCAGINALLFGTLLYRSRLVPRWIPTLGLVGGPLLLAASVATILGIAEIGSVWFLGVIPLATWELSVGVWMTVKGFRPSPLTAIAPGPRTAA